MTEKEFCKGLTESTIAFLGDMYYPPLWFFLCYLITSFTFRYYLVKGCYKVSTKSLKQKKESLFRNQQRWLCENDRISIPGPADAKQARKLIADRFEKQAVNHGRA